VIKRLPPSLRPRFPGGDTWSEKIAVIARHRPSSPRSAIPATNLPIGKASLCE